MVVDLSFFNEKLFTVAAAHKYSYATRISQGYEHMRTLRVVIGGLARNIESVIILTKARLERIGSLFADYRIVIFENDSADKTPEILRDWADANDKVTVFTQVFNDPVNQQVRCLNRATRMAGYRNLVREFIISEYPDFNNVILVDTDVGGGYSYDGLAHTFGHTEWDVVSSQGIIFKGGRPLFFDVWAYRSLGSYAPLLARVVNPRIYQLGIPMISVYSGFGGMACYSMDAFKSSIYEGTDCEHVPFHKTMRDKGFARQYMNPSQIVLY